MRSKIELSVEKPPWNNILQFFEKGTYERHHSVHTLQLYKKEGELDNVTQQLADTAINARNFGLDENATWQVNRDALQAANDSAYAQGGGRVLIPSGVYNVKGVFQDSHVEFTGNGATLKHPDGIGAGIIRSRVYETIGSIIKDANQLTVSDSSNIEEGSIVAIRAAGGILNSQRTTIVDEIDASQTSGIKLAVTTGFLNNGFLQIGEEIFNTQA